MQPEHIVVLVLISSLVSYLIARWESRRYKDKRITMILNQEVRSHIQRLVTGYVIDKEVIAFIKDQALSISDSELKTYLAEKVFAKDLEEQRGLEKMIGEKAEEVFKYQFSYKFERVLDDMKYNHQDLPEGFIQMIIARINDFQIKQGIK